VGGHPKLSLIGKSTSGHPPSDTQMMTGRHKNRGVNFRPDPDLKERFKAATTQAGTSMAAELTAFVRWYVGDTDELPNRVTNVMEHHI